MSALGHKRTYAVQKGTSALPPIAPAKAKFRKRPKDQKTVSALPPKADICYATAYVCLAKADMTALIQAP